MQPVELISDRLLFDQPREADVDAIAEYCADPVFEHFMTLPWPYQRSDAEHWVREIAPAGWANETEATWAIRDRGEPDAIIGTIGVRRARSDLGYWLGPPFRGKGYMVEAVQRVLLWIHDTQFTDLGETGWWAMQGNIASATVARKAGFRFVGSADAPLPQRDGTHPPAWLGAHRWGGGDEDASWPPETRRA